MVYSGRGRPRTKEIVDRPLPVGIVLGSPSPGSDIFKNRKIRVGRTFQAKVPKKPLGGKPEEGQQQPTPSSVYQNCRKPPQRVSAEHPHLTRDEVDQYEATLQQLQQKNHGPLTSTIPEGKNGGYHAQISALSVVVFFGLELAFVYWQQHKLNDSTQRYTMVSPLRRPRLDVLYSFLLSLLLQRVDDCLYPLVVVTCGAAI